MSYIYGLGHDKRMIISCNPMAGTIVWTVWFSFHAWSSTQVPWSSPVSSIIIHQRRRSKDFDFMRLVLFLYGMHLLIKFHKHWSKRFHVHVWIVEVIPCPLLCKHIIISSTVLKLDSSDFSLITGTAFAIQSIVLDNLPRYNMIYHNV